MVVLLNPPVVPPPIPTVRRSLSIPSPGWTSISSCDVIAHPVFSSDIVTLLYLAAGERESIVRRITDPPFPPYLSRNNSST